MMRKIGLLSSSLFLVLAAIAGCAKQTPPEETAPPDSGNVAFVITSPAFADGANIPVEYTCNGQNISPELNWAQTPAGTASFALIMDDPDAVYTHWVIFNLPPDASGLPEAVPKDDKLANAALQGKIGSGGIGYPTGYFGPCPPKGSPHHYRFTLYALDTSLDLTAGASKEQVLQAMDGHILGQAQLVGLYQR
ncbi:MAG: YbhB/YbcL family Raf kinase inhibitor-like protein [Dehalococcoidia bacterium]|nr:YbhB/YbcL family Raf kinase inhibitor-like protein [Dehalococcoidia bacterium]